MKTYKLVFFVPVSHVEQVKEAVFCAGAGQQGEYAKCCWQSRGIGQFQPLVGSAPFIGEVDTLCQVEEYRVEVLCYQTDLVNVLEALKQAHPYEAPAWDVFLRQDLADFS